MYRPGEGSETCQSPQNLSEVFSSVETSEISVSRCGAEAPTDSDAGSPCESSDRCPQDFPSPRLHRVSHDEDDQTPASGCHSSSRRRTPEQCGVEGSSDRTDGAARRGCGEHEQDGLAAWMADLNKASRKKDLLKAFCEERLKLSLSGSETIPVLQKKAARQIYEVSVASAMDPVGFGKWSTLTYGQLR